MIHILTTRARQLSKAQERLPVRLVAPGADWTASFEAGDLVYLDIEDVNAERQDEIVEAFKSRCENVLCQWGLLDLAGSYHDPARAFFNGAVDYIGPEPGLAGINAARFKAIQAWMARSSAEAGGGAASRAGRSPGRMKSGSARAKGSDRTASGSAVSHARFPGWKRLEAGLVRSFHLLYLAPHDQGSLRRRLGERGFDTLIGRLETLVRERLAGCDPLLWMQSEGSLLYLVPVEGQRPACMVEGLLRLFMDLPVLAVERFGLSLSLPLVCAVHSGELPFVPPGATASLVSEPVNYIFHLGTKRAQSDRITLSDNVLAAVPPSLSDIFAKDGVFEGRDIYASRRFCNLEGAN